MDEKATWSRREPSLKKTLIKERERPGDGKGEKKDIDPHPALSLATRSAKCEIYQKQSLLIIILKMERRRVKSAAEAEESLCFSPRHEKRRALNGPGNKRIDPYIVKTRLKKESQGQKRAIAATDRRLHAGRLKSLMNKKIIGETRKAKK